jgi:Alpha-galactosidase
MLLLSCLITVAYFLLCHFEKSQPQVALTPPMGWNSWNLFEEEVFGSIVIDDYWVGGRNANNELYPAPRRFPNGMKALANYIHARGVKLGIYSDAAAPACGGVTGSYNFEEQDAGTFASWGIDYLKYDYCNAPEHMTTAFTRYKKWAMPCAKPAVQLFIRSANGDNASLDGEPEERSQLSHTAAKC